jgi:hypothetical protein
MSRWLPSAEVSWTHLSIRLSPRGAIYPPISLQALYRRRGLTRTTLIGTFPVFTVERFCGSYLRRVHTRISRICPYLVRFCSCFTITAHWPSLLYRTHNVVKGLVMTILNVTDCYDHVFFYSYISFDFHCYIRGL